jgi:hypothetical protein
VGCGAATQGTHPEQHLISLLGTHVTHANVDKRLSLEDCVDHPKRRSIVTDSVDAAYFSVRRFVLSSRMPPDAHFVETLEVSVARKIPRTEAMEFPPKWLMNY